MHILHTGDREVPSCIPVHFTTGYAFVVPISSSGRVQPEFITYNIFKRNTYLSTIGHCIYNGRNCFRVCRVFNYVLNLAFIRGKIKHFDGAKKKLGRSKTYLGDIFCPYLPSLHQYERIYGKFYRKRRRRIGILSKYRPLSVTWTDCTISHT